MLLFREMTFIFIIGFDKVAVVVVFLFLRMLLDLLCQFQELLVTRFHLRLHLVELCSALLNLHSEHIVGLLARPEVYLDELHRIILL